MTHGEAASGKFIERTSQLVAQLSKRNEALSPGKTSHRLSTVSLGDDGPVEDFGHGIDEFFRRGRKLLLLPSEAVHARLMRVGGGLLYRLMHS